LIGRAWSGNLGDRDGRSDRQCERSFSWSRPTACLVSTVSICVALISRRCHCVIICKAHPENYGTIKSLVCLGVMCHLCDNFSPLLGCCVPLFTRPGRPYIGKLLNTPCPKSESTVFYSHNFNKLEFPNSDTNHPVH